MSPKLKSVLIQILLLAAGMLMLYLAFRGQNLKQLAADFAGANYRYVGASLGVLLLSHFLRALRWQMLIRAAGYQPRSFSCFCAVMIGYLANLAVPRLGEVTRCSVIYRTDRAPMDRLIGTVITERIADLAMLALVMLSVAVIKANYIFRFVHDQFSTGRDDHFSGKFYLYSKLAVAGLVILALILWVVRRKKEAILGLVPVQKFLGFVKGVVSGMKSILEIKNWPLFVIYSISIWLGYALSTWLVFHALQSTSKLGFGDALYVLVAGSIGMIAPVQGGIGTYHFMVSQALLLLGIRATEGLAYATINHSSQLVLFLVAGAAAFAGIFMNDLSNNRQKANP